MLLRSPGPTERLGELTGAVCLDAFPKGSLSAARAVRLASRSPPPGEHALPDTAASGDAKSQAAEISPAFSIKLTQGAALAPFSSTLTHRADVGRARKTRSGISH